MRSEFRRRISEISSRVRKAKSGKILKKILKDVLFQEAKTVFTYVALPQEVQTAGLIRQALRLGKRVFAPRMKARNPHFDICEILDPVRHLKKGRYGVLEPKRGRKIHRGQLDLIIVPGLAFDKEGNRLGRGKGFFDRFLEKTGKTPKIGLAFKEQMTKKIPVERHDIPMDRIITG